MFSVAVVRCPSSQPCTKDVFPSVRDQNGFKCSTEKTKLFLFCFCVCFTFRWRSLGSWCYFICLLWHRWPLLPLSVGAVAAVAARPAHKNSLLQFLCFVWKIIFTFLLPSNQLSRFPFMSSIVFSLATFVGCDHRKFNAFSKTKQTRTDSELELFRILFTILHNLTQSDHVEYANEWICVNSRMARNPRRYNCGSYIQWSSRIYLWRIGRRKINGAMW